MVAEGHRCPVGVLRRDLIEDLPQRLSGGKGPAIDWPSRCFRADLSCAPRRFSSSGHRKAPNVEVVQMERISLWWKQCVALKPWREAR
jgi:hypothetical protein